MTSRELIGAIMKAESISGSREQLINFYQSNIDEIGIEIDDMNRKIKELKSAQNNFRRLRDELKRVAE